jgi:hypothetical protein
MLVGSGRTFEDVFREIRRAFDYLEKPQVNMASVTLHNLLTSVKEKLERRYHPALMICALFVNREDEDMGKLDEEFMKTKIEDWQKEGFDVKDFFQLAWNLVPGFIEHYKDDLSNISKLLNEVQDTSKKSE